MQIKLNSKIEKANLKLVKINKIFLQKIKPKTDSKIH